MIRKQRSELAAARADLILADEPAAEARPLP
jgi:ABC-type phosphate/phosphonate transport system ATPase subunit